MRGLSTMEQLALEPIQGEEMLDRVWAWARVNSGSRHLAGLERMADLLAGAFSALPGDIRMVPPEPVEAMAPDGTLRSQPHGANLHLVVRPEAPVQILLTGHMDTVFGEDHPFQDVFWREEGVLGGPGVADMKGGLSVMLTALSAIESSPAAKRIGYEVVINSDEEVGSSGSAALLARAAHGKRAALTYEPSALPDGTLAGARPGSGNFSLKVTGRSAHAGRNPEDGRNALVAAADLALGLDAGRRPGLSVNPSRIDGGSPTNVVPDHAVLRVNMRPANAEDEASGRALIETEVERVRKARQVEIDVHGGFGRPPKPIGPEALKLYELVQSCGADLGQDIGWRDTGGVCDGNNIAACGVPVVDTMGVRGGAIHSDREYMIVESLEERARLSALVMLRMAENAS